MVEKSILEDYLCFLQSKGFVLEQDSVGFIYFGKHSTNAPEHLVKTAIEITLKAQRQFDGSFYLSLLESLVENNITKREEALKYVQERGLLSS